MAYVSLYRKYRSQSFSDLCGQDHIVRTLQNGIKSGRIAHAYLFVGPRGTGKTSSARLLAKSLNCEKGPTPEPCNECSTCLSIKDGSAIDVFEMDAASEAGVEEVREQIVKAAEYLPTMSRYKIYIIDEVHDLSSKAFDALLKTIEEPPAHVIFILATTEYSKVPATIRSRCQKHEFHRASMTDLVSRLKYVAESERIEAEPAAITAIARMADGGYRDALNLLEQASLGSEGVLTLAQIYDQMGLIAESTTDTLLKALRDADVPTMLQIVEDVIRIGRDPKAIVESLQYRLSDLSKASFGIELTPGDAAANAATNAAASQLGRPFLVQMRGMLAETHKALGGISLPRLWLESELIRLSNQVNAPAPTAAPAHQEAAQAGRAAVKSPVESVTKEAPRAQHAEQVPKPTTKPVQVAAPEKSGDSALDDARDIWFNVMSQLPVGTPIAMRLSESQVSQVSEGTLYIKVKRQMDVEWSEDPKRKLYLTKALREQTQKDWNLIFHAEGAAPT